MEFQLDPKKFDQYQTILIHEIALAIKIKLIEAGLEGEQLQETTSNMSASIASIIDDTTEIVSNGTEVHPYLAFRLNDDAIIHGGENSYTYDRLVSALNRAFE